MDCSWDIELERIIGRADMQELEKILKEIDETIERYGENPYIDEKVTDLCYGMNIAKGIIYVDGEEVLQ